MILQVTEPLLPQLRHFCKETPFGCKIEGLWRAYGLDLPFARFWVQQAANGSITAAVSCLDGAAVLDWRSTADGEELTAFLSAVGCRTLLCEEPAGQALYGRADRTGVILRRAALPDTKEEATETSSVRPIGNLREMFQLLCVCGELQEEQFEAFYLDASHRIRHHASVAVGISKENQLIACAMAGSMTEEIAVLSAVAVHPKWRRQGVGSTLLQGLLPSLIPRRVFVLCESEQATLFYTSLSFSVCGAWSELDF